MLCGGPGGSFEDPGATATDAVDGDIDVTVTGTVDTSTVGSYTITYTATDSSGNTSTATRVVNVVDTTAPVVICQDITLELSDTGSANITAEDLDNGSNDYSGISQMSIELSTFDCSNLGYNNVALTVTDLHGNSETCEALVLVADITAPSIIAPSELKTLSA